MPKQTMVSWKIFVFIILTYNGSPTTCLPTQHAGDNPSLSSALVQSKEKEAEPQRLWESIAKIDESLNRVNDYSVVIMESGEEDDELSRLLFRLQGMQMRKRRLRLQKKGGNRIKKNITGDNTSLQHSKRSSTPNKRKKRSVQEDGKQKLKRQKRMGKKSKERRGGMTNCKNKSREKHRPKSHERPNHRSREKLGSKGPGKHGPRSHERHGHRSREKHGPKGPGKPGPGNHGGHVHRSREKHGPKGHRKHGHPSRERPKPKSQEMCVMDDTETTMPEVTTSKTTTATIPDIFSSTTIKSMTTELPTLTTSILTTTTPFSSSTVAKPQLPTQSVLGGETVMIILPTTSPNYEEVDDNRSEEKVDRNPENNKDDASVSYEEITFSPDAETLIPFLKTELI